MTDHALRAADQQQTRIDELEAQLRRTEIERDEARARWGQAGPDRTLARTWNFNQAGLLWEASWCVRDGHYVRQSFASSFFMTPTVFRDAAHFWDEFEKEQALFHGARFEGFAA